MNISVLFTRCQGIFSCPNRTLSGRQTGVRDNHSHIQAHQERHYQAAVLTNTNTTAAGFTG